VTFMKRELLRLEKQSEHFIDRIAETQSINLIVAYECKVEKLEEDKLLLNEKIKNCGRPLATVDDTFRTAINFLGNPQRLWDTGNLNHKRLVLKLAFSERLPYVRNEGFRTPAKALPFSLLEQIHDGEYKMVRPKRFELLTP
jgi:site-specific DNA recombinase